MSRSDFSLSEYLSYRPSIKGLLGRALTSAREWETLSQECERFHGICHGLVTHIATADGRRAAVSLTHWKSWLAAAEALREIWGEFDSLSGPVAHSDLRVIWIRRNAYLLVGDSLGWFPWALDRLSRQNAELLLGFSPGICWRLSTAYDDFSWNQEHGKGGSNLQSDRPWWNFNTIDYGNCGSPYQTMQSVSGLSTLWYRLVDELPAGSDALKKWRDSDSNFAPAYNDGVGMYYPSATRDTNPADYLEFVASLLYYYPGAFVDTARECVGSYLEWFRSRQWDHGNEAPWASLASMSPDPSGEMPFSLKLKSYIKSFPSNLGGDTACFEVEYSAPFRLVLVCAWGGCPTTSSFSVSALRALGLPSFMVNGNHHGWYSPAPQVEAGIPHSDWMIHGSAPWIPSIMSTSVHAVDNMLGMRSMEAYHFPKAGSDERTLAQEDFLARGLPEIAHRGFARVPSTFSQISSAASARHEARRNRLKVVWRDDDAATKLAGAHPPAAKLLAAGLTKLLQSLIELDAPELGKKWMGMAHMLLGVPPPKSLQGYGSAGEAVLSIESLDSITEAVYGAMGKSFGAPALYAGTMPGIFGLVALSAMRISPWSSGIPWSNTQINRSCAAHLGTPLNGGLNFATPPSTSDLSFYWRWTAAAASSSFPPDLSNSETVWNSTKMKSQIASAKLSPHWNSSLDGVSVLWADRNYTSWHLPGKEWQSDLP